MGEEQTTFEDFNPVRASLDTARAELRSNLETGSRCPCCGQFVKLYRRKMTGTMAAILISFVRTWLPRRGWIHVRDIPLPGGDARLSGGDLAKLRHWGLVEAKPNDDPQKRTSGYWRPTQGGLDFVFGRAEVPLRVHLLFNVVDGYSGKPILIQDALGKKFSYPDLMGGLMDLAKKGT